MYSNLIEFVIFYLVTRHNKNNKNTTTTGGVHVQQHVVGARVLVRARLLMLTGRDLCQRELDGLPKVLIATVPKKWSAANLKALSPI